MIYVVSTAILIGSLIYSCSKEEITTEGGYYETNTKNQTTDKSINQSEKAVLMSAISGQAPYDDITFLRDLLVEKAPLSNDVLIKLINTSRIPDELIELLVLISNPSDKQTLKELKARRPNFDLTNIKENASFADGKQFKIVYTEQIVLIMASEIKHTKENGCETCNSILETSDDVKIINIGSGNGHNPMNRRCDSTKNECGQATAVVRKAGSRPSSPIFQVICDRNVDVVCINGKASE